MEEDVKKPGCTGRCENCSVNQRTYCASQMAYYAQQEISELKAMLLAVIGKKEENVIVLRGETVGIEDVTED